MDISLIQPRPLSVLENGTRPVFRAGLEWWRQNDGVIRTDDEVRAILRHMQLSVVEQIGVTPPYLHVGEKSLAARVWGDDWAIASAGLPGLPDEEFDKIITDEYGECVIEKKPFMHTVIAPLDHPKHGECVIHYDRLLMPVRFPSGITLVGSLQFLRSLVVLKGTEYLVGTSTPANHQDSRWDVQSSGIRMVHSDGSLRARGTQTSR